MKNTEKEMAQNVSQNLQSLNVEQIGEIYIQKIKSSNQALFKKYVGKTPDKLIIQIVSGTASLVDLEKIDFYVGKPQSIPVPKNQSAIFNETEK